MDGGVTHQVYRRADHVGYGNTLCGFLFDEEGVISYQVPEDLRDVSAAGEVDCVACIGRSR